MFYNQLFTERERERNVLMKGWRGLPGYSPDMLLQVLGDDYDIYTDNHTHIHILHCLQSFGQPCGPQESQQRFRGA